MISLDEDALICDLAETYRIYEYRSLPVRLVATLSAGLRDDSRIKLKAAGAPVGLETILLASIADRVEAFRYGFMSDSKTKEPPSIVKILMGEDKNETDALTFKTPEEFKRALEKARGET